MLSHEEKHRIYHGKFKSLSRIYLLVNDLSDHVTFYSISYETDFI